MSWSLFIYLIAITGAALSFESHAKYVTSHRPALARLLLSSEPISKRLRSGATKVSSQRRSVVGEGVRRLSVEVKKQAKPKTARVPKTDMSLQRSTVVRKVAIRLPASIAAPANIEVDQALMLATVGGGVLLATLWLSPMGGEYWTAASRSAVVAMLRTIGADYATQLGKHKLGLTSARGGQDSDAGSVIEKAASVVEFQPDLNRTFSMGMFYLLYYIGPKSYVLTELFPRWFGNDGTWGEVWSKVLVENLLWTPFGYWVLWSLCKVGIDRYLERGQQVIGDTKDEGLAGNLAQAVWRDVTTDFWKKNRASSMFWVPADILNFKFVDQYYVPTAMVFEGAIWAAILGTIEYDQKEKSGSMHDNTSTK